MRYLSLPVLPLVPLFLAQIVSYKSDDWFPMVTNWVTIQPSQWAYIQRLYSIIMVRGRHPTAQLYPLLNYPEYVNHGIEMLTVLVEYLNPIRPKNFLDNVCAPSDINTAANQTPADYIFQLCTITNCL